MTIEDLARHPARSTDRLVRRPWPEIGSSSAPNAAPEHTVSDALRFERHRIWPDRQWEASVFTLRGVALDRGLSRPERRPAAREARNGIGVADGRSKPSREHWYASTFQDKAGEPLFGSRSYRLVFRGDAPMCVFWSLTAHDRGTGASISGEGRSVGLSSCSRIDRAEDGSVELFLGPLAPRGKRRNWIRTDPGCPFFARFRLYGALEPVFRGSWRLDDIEEVVPSGRAQPATDAVASSSAAGPT